MKYSKEYLILNLDDRCKIYHDEINKINDALASGYYAYNKDVLSILRKRKLKLDTRIHNLTMIEVNRLK